VGEVFLLLGMGGLTKRGDFLVGKYLDYLGERKRKKKKKKQGKVCIGIWNFGMN
jgi:hypothetical protein